MNDLIVVLATYNEAATIQDLLEGLTAYPVIVVDDNSPDGTAALTRLFSNVYTLVRERKLGIASAYQLGFAAALVAPERYRFIAQMDAGGTHNPNLIATMHDAAILNNAGLVIGSRFLCPVRWYGYRTAISLVAAWLMRLKGVPVYDATSGFRLWRREVLERVRPAIRAHGFAFQLETLMAAQRAGACILELPIPYRLTNSSFKPGMLWEALRVWWRV